LKIILKNILSNIINKKDRSSKLIEIQNKIQYKFKDTTLLIDALTHTSYNYKNNISEFERMEFLGDSILGLIVAEAIFRKFPESQEGNLSKLKSKLVSTKYLALKAKELNLSEYIFLSEEAIKSGGKNSSSILADAMESLICSIYLDSNIEQVRKFINKFILKNFTDELKTGYLTNYKSILQEYTQSKYHNQPYYKVIKEEGPEHKKLFTVEVYINSKKIGIGKGPNKKEAQQYAAKKACLFLGI